MLSESSDAYLVMRYTRSQYQLEYTNCAPRELYELTFSIFELTIHATSTVLESRLLDNPSTTPN